MSQGAPDDFRPCASLETLRLRAKLLGAARRFFDKRGYFEVDTPVLSRDRAIDSHIEPFAALLPEGASMQPARFLQTSVEFCMKRLLAHGAGPIYQVSHVFRAGERGPLHNPEFTMIEWYAPGTNHLDQMRVTESLVQTLARCAGRAWHLPFDRVTYAEAFLTHAGVEPHLCDTDALRIAARSAASPPPESLDPDDRDGWLNFLLAERVEPRLGIARPAFLHEYPESQAALARVRPGPPRVAERFELYVRGVEVCNGYHELTDAAEFSRRLAAESARRQQRGQAPLNEMPLLRLALEAGLPDCAGVALGFDRLMMLLLDYPCIDQVLPFSWERA